MANQVGIIIFSVAKDLHVHHFFRDLRYKINDVQMMMDFI